MPPKFVQPVRYFLRDDDVGGMTDALRFFVEAFLDRNLPVSYQIIPERLTQECADYLVAKAKAHPGLLSFGQHGLRHEMSVRGKRLKREFGPERSLAQQSQDIAQGLAILNARMGSEVKIELFTPPQHKFDRNTLLAVAAAGHKLFSAATYPTLHHRLAYGLGRRLKLSSVMHHGISHHGDMRPEADLREISISVAVDNGRFVVTDAARLGGALRTAAKFTPVVGLMLHHEVYGNAAGRAELEAIADQISNLAGGNISILEDVAMAPAAPMHQAQR